jgi:hypothetical protein
MHSQASALIMLFTETATHIWTQQALQLSLFIEIALRLEAPYPAEEQNTESHYVSFIGGYLTNKKALFREIQNKQIKRSPLDILQELEENLNTDYTTTEERFNIKRASSPISSIKETTKKAMRRKQNTKQHLRKKKPERNSALTASRASRTKYSKRNRKHRKEKRRAEISSPERQMSISPSPRRSPPRRATKRSPSSRRRASRTPDRPTITRTVTGRSLSRKASRRSPSRSEYSPKMSAPQNVGVYENVGAHEIF